MEKRKFKSLIKCTEVGNKSKLTATYCAVLAVSPAACKHPQIPACLNVFSMEQPPTDTPSHFSTAPDDCRAQSTALIQYECAALKT